ncbi:MAG: lectin-like protein [Polyangiales bacterium]
MRFVFRFALAALALSACAVADESARDARPARDASAGADTATAMDSGVSVSDSGVAQDTGVAPTDSATSAMDTGAVAPDTGIPCGNGRVDPGEQCDDGNRVDTDACRNDCRVARCGDGVLRPNVEECDDGNTDPHDGCTTACVRCSSGGSVEEPSSGSCYRREEAANTYDAMRSLCEMSGDRLAIFSDAAQWNAIRPMLIDGRSSVWIGATDSASEGSWVWSDGSPLSFTNWAAGEPNNAGDEDCAEAGSQWNDLNCGDSRPALCQRVRWTVRPTDGHAYRLWTRAVPFADAESACAAIGAHLVTLSDASERMFVRAVAGGASAWIGLEDRGTEGTFRWVNSEPVRETAWAAGEPNNAGDEDCTQLRTDDLWNDLSCASALPYVCEAE